MYPGPHFVGAILSARLASLSQSGCCLFSDRAVRKSRGGSPESLRIYPDNVTAYENLAGFYLALNRLPEARETTDQALARKLDEELLHTNAYSLAFLQGDSAAMAQQAAWFEGKADVENEILALESATEPIPDDSAKRAS